MDEKQLTELKEHLKEVVEETVNGKIKDLSEMIKEHQKEVQPMLEWFVGMKFTKRLVIGGFALAGMVVAFLLGIKKLI